MRRAVCPSRSTGPPAAGGRRHFNDASPARSPSWRRVPVTRHWRTRLLRAGGLRLTADRPSTPVPPGGCEPPRAGGPGSRGEALGASALGAALRRLSLSLRRGRVSPSLCRTRRPSESLVGVGGGVSGESTGQRRDDQRAHGVGAGGRRPPTRGLSLQVHPCGPLLLHRVRGLLQPPGRGPRGVVWLPSVRPTFSLENDAEH